MNDKIGAGELKSAVSTAERSLKIHHGLSEREYHFVWLRDHCKCESCYNHVTSQRKISLLDFPLDIKPKNSVIEDDDLIIVYGHKSTYSLSYLDGLSYENYVNCEMRKYVLWKKNDIINFDVCHVDFQQLLKSQEAVSNVIKSLIDFGVAFVENVPADVKGTEQAISRLSHVQQTLFGRMWEFSDSMDHSDTAYTSEALGAHTDNTYFTEAAGLQVLHCLNHTGTGGENLLVDGFKAVEILKSEHPDVFDRLTQVPVAAEYLEPGFHHKYSAPIIKLHPVTGQPEQIRFNTFDRAAVSLPKDKILNHYHDYRLLVSIVKNPELEWKFKLNPGTVLIFDNFRILHGRTSYTGHRTMCGCYIGRGDFLSKARVLKLL